MTHGCARLRNFWASFSAFSLPQGSLSYPLVVFTCAASPKCEKKRTSQKIGSVLCFYWDSFEEGWVFLRDFALRMGVSLWITAAIRGVGPLTLLRAHTSSQIFDLRRRPESLLQKILGHRTRKGAGIFRIGLRGTVLIEVTMSQISRWSAASFSRA